MLPSSSATALAWERLIDATEDAVFAGGLERSWVDEPLPDDARVTKVYLDTECGSALDRHALYLTEFFNASVERAAYIGDSIPTACRSGASTSAGGRCCSHRDDALMADYVFTQPGIELEGGESRRHGRGSRALADRGPCASSARRRTTTSARTDCNCARGAGSRSG